MMNQPSKVAECMKLINELPKMCPCSLSVQPYNNDDDVWLFLSLLSAQVVVRVMPHQGYLVFFVFLYFCIFHFLLSHSIFHLSVPLILAWRASMLVEIGGSRRQKAWHQGALAPFFILVRVSIAKIDLLSWPSCSSVWVSTVLHVWTLVCS